MGELWDSGMTNPLSGSYDDSPYTIGDSPFSTMTSSGAAYAPQGVQPVAWYETLAGSVAGAAGTLLGGFTTKLLYGDEYATTDAALKQAAAWRSVNGSGTNDPWGLSNLAPRDLVDMLTGKRTSTAAPSSGSILPYVIMGAVLLLAILLIRR